MLNRTVAHLYTLKTSPESGMHRIEVVTLPFPVCNGRPVQQHDVEEGIIEEDRIHRLEG